MAASDGVIETELARVARRARKADSDSAFRASVQARLDHLESQLDEVKGRLNGLLFFIAGTVIAQVVLRLVA
jgi:hypothetical protein